ARAHVPAAPAVVRQCGGRGAIARRAAGGILRGARRLALRRLRVALVEAVREREALALPVALARRVRARARLRRPDAIAIPADRVEARVVGRHAQLARGPVQRSRDTRVVRRTGGGSCESAVDVARLRSVVDPDGAGLGERAAVAVALAGEAMRGAPWDAVAV